MLCVLWGCFQNCCGLSRVNIPRRLQIRLSDADTHRVGIQSPDGYSVPESNGAGDRRKSSERRESPTRIWDSLLGFYRRQRGRRVGESDNIYVDSYTRQDLLLTVAVLLLNILDAFFTLRWLGMGGGEGNPLMDLLIRADDMLFLFQKCVVVGIWLIILVVHKNFRIARMGLWGAFILYMGILLYHVVLQVGNPPVRRPATEARELSICMDATVECSEWRVSQAASN